MGFKESLAFVIGLGVAGFGVSILDKHYNSTKEAIVQSDLNQDGICDLVLEKNKGYKVPMYGIREGENIRYVSASEMMERNPNSLIDYGKIELKLNSKE